MAGLTLLRFKQQRHTLEELTSVLPNSLSPSKAKQTLALDQIQRLHHDMQLGPALAFTCVDSHSLLPEYALFITSFSSFISTVAACLQKLHVTDPPPGQRECLLSVWQILVQASIPSSQKLVLQVDKSVRCGP